MPSTSFALVGLSFSVKYSNGFSTLDKFALVDKILASYVSDCEIPSYIVTLIYWYKRTEMMRISIVEADANCTINLNLRLFWESKTYTRVF